MTIQLLIGVFAGLVVFMAGWMLARRRRNSVPDADSQDVPKLVLGPLTNSFAAALPLSRNVKDRVRAELIQAGYYGRCAFENFVAIRTATLMSWILFAVAVCLIPLDRLAIPYPQRLGFGAIMAILIYGLPGVLLSAQAEARKRVIHQSLPDALDMLSMMMTGGLGMTRALLQVSKEIKSSHPDLACELAIVHQQTEVGSFDRAIKNLADRVDQPEIRSLAMLVLHTEKLGTPVTGALIEYSDTMRRARRQRAEESGNKRSVMLLIPVIVFLAPPIYILLLGPAALELRDFMTGQRDGLGTVSQATVRGR